MHVNNLCRICLVELTKNKETRPLFDPNQKECAEIVKQIEECGGIELKPLDKFPKTICIDCVDLLNISYKFRSLCQASESALLHIIVKDETSLLCEEKNDKTKSEEILFNELITTEDINFEDITEFKESDSDSEYLEEFEYHNTANIEPKSENEDDEPLAKISENLENGSLKQKIARRPRTIRIEKKIKGKRGRPRTRDILNGTAKKAGKRGRKKVEETETKIICEICGNIYTKQSLLNMHMRRHTSEKPFDCEICGKAFACASEIARHIRVHTGEKPYVCKFCGRTFADRSTNIKHERIHTNERPFKCGTCGKSFTYSNVLKNHMLTHTGEKPFLCEPCNKTFSRKHQLDQHISTLTHQQTVKRLVEIKNEEFTAEETMVGQEIQGN